MRFQSLEHLVSEANISQLIWLNLIDVNGDDGVSGCLTKTKTVYAYKHGEAQRYDFVIGRLTDYSFSLYRDSEIATICFLALLA